MAQLLQNGSIKMHNGRILWGRDPLQIIDLQELGELLLPKPQVFTGGFGFGGGGGRGERGPQGPAGSGGGGVQGPQGPAGGGGGAQGAQGNQGNQGFQGALSTDIYAATRVVSLIAGDGTDLTIASAIAALPAEGGLIFVKQGTYPIAATLALTDKPIEIVGCGDGTILDLAGSGIPAFTAAFARKYVIRDLRVIGSVANVNRRVVSISAAASVDLIRVTGINIRTVFEVTGGAAAVLEAEDCTISLLSGAASWFVLANGSTSIHADNVSVTGASNAGGISGAPIAELFGCTLTAANGIVTGDESVFSGSSFTGTAGETVSLGDLTRVTACRFVSLFIDVSGNENKFTGCLFHGSLAQTRCMDVTSPITGPAIEGCSFFGCTTDQLRIGAIDTIVQSCVFFDNGTLVRAIDVLASSFRTIIEGNNFQFMDEAIQMGSANCIVTGNVGCKVVEVGAANVNVYADNTGFNPATIIGASSRIENYQTLTVGVDFLLTEFQRTLEVDASGAPRTITLPTALSARWRKYTIKKIDASANTVTIDADGAETIDGALTQVLSSQWEAITIQSNGVSWIILSEESPSGGADIFVGTRVVSLIPGEGTDLTIAAAIAALPAGGGSIYIKEGTFPLGASLVLTDKPILFVGSGDATVIDLGANAIDAFSIPFDRPYKFQNLKILGSGIAGQVAFHVSIAASSVNTITLENVTVDNIEKTFLVNPGDFPLIYTSDCVFNVADLVTSFHWDGAGEWHAVNTYAIFTGGTARGGFANNPDLYAVNCEFWIPNGGALNFAHVDRCKFMSGTLTVAAQGSIIGDSIFDTAALLARFIDLPIGANSVGISNCMFGSATAEQIRIASNNNNIVGCQPCKVTETGSADGNRYVNNIGFTTSTIIGPSSVVEEALRAQATGVATVDALTAVFTHTNFKGLSGAGSIKNVGVTNTLTVRRTATDGYGVTDFQEDDVLPGATLTWPLDTAVGTALPEFTSFTVSVRSTVPGSPTTFDLRHTSHGAMS